ncbi:MAG: hypothetical protein EOP41_08460 [Sphingobacteriaceae bacterium]|nr:MAG: hypothetical protein EOP41_08460 [Sphingobacteriaceae bacterium]
MKILLSTLLLSSLILTSCGEDFSPKPRGFNRIDVPAHQYKKLDENHPYTFEHSIYAEVLKDTSAIAEEHWIDLWYPQFRSNIQITLKFWSKLLICGWRLYNTNVIL